MNPLEPLRNLGLLDARVPRYTSYPPANHFAGGVTAATVADWLESVPENTDISLYVHVPYCRNLCWFCACRTQGTATDRPLVPYLATLKTELEMVSRHLPASVRLGHVHLGGGTPTILPPEMLADLCESIRAFRPLSESAEFSVEIDPTEIDAARIGVLAEHGMTRASIGVQDFDPVVQESIGRRQPYDLTRDVADMLRAAGIRSLNMDVLYGLPHQTRARLATTVQRVMSLEPDRVALFGYAHVPWMAKRQQLIPAEALPDAEGRLELFETARRLLSWDGYRSIGIDHFARPGDSLAEADRLGMLRRNFQGYTDDQCDTLVGIGASAISRYPQGYAQNESTSSRHAAAVQDGRLPVGRGHVFTADDRLRGAMIDEIMCRFALDLPALSRAHGVPLARLREMTAPMRERFADWLEVEDGGDRLRIVRNGALLARMVAQMVDAYDMPEGRHSRAL